MKVKYQALFLCLGFLLLSLSSATAQLLKIKKQAAPLIKQLKVEQFYKKVFLDLQKNTLTTSKEIISKSNPKKQNDFRQVSYQNKVGELTIKMQESELVITYPAKPLQDKEYYIVRLTARLNGNPLTIPPEMIKQGLGQIHIFGLMEKYTQLSGNLELNVVQETWGEYILPYGVTCDVMPTFTSKQKLPHWIGFGVGAAAIGAGRFLRTESNDIYNNQYLTAESQDAAAPFYTEANNKRKQYLALTYFGGGLIVADAILLIIRQNRYKKRLKVFNEFCGQEGLSLQPTLDFSTPGTASAQVGLRMQLTF